MGKAETADCHSDTPPATFRLVFERGETQVALALWIPSRGVVLFAGCGDAKADRTSNAVIGVIIRPQASRRLARGDLEEAMIMSQYFDPQSDKCSRLL